MKFLLSAAAGLLLVIVGAAPAMADATTATFEPPSWQAGPVDGQHGWTATGAYDYGVVANSGAPAKFGRQSFRISSQTTSGSFGDWAFSQPAANEAGEASNHDRFTGEFSFLALGVQAVEGSHISVSPDRGDGARMSYVRLEDHADGVHVLFRDYAGTTADTLDDHEYDIATLDRTAPHTIKFDMQFVPGPSNDVVKVYVDGQLKFTGTSWEQYYRVDEGHEPGNVDRLILQARGTATDFGTAPEAQRGFLIDNVTVGTPDDQGPQGPAGPAGPTGATGATGGVGQPGLSGSKPSAAPKLVGNTVRLIHLAVPHGERLVSARATLGGVPLKVRGRTITVDLRGRAAGTYDVRIVAKHRKTDGTIHVVRASRHLRVVSV
jgi:hypothetical protein